MEQNATEPAKKYRIPIVLVRQDRPDEIIAYACGRCGTVAGSPRTHGEHAQEMAEKHCGPWACEKCGVDHDRSYQMLCSKCWSKAQEVRRADRELAALAKAARVPEREYTGPLYVDGSGHNDGFFRDLEELHEWYEDEEHELPEYAWACDVRHPALDADSLEEQALEDTVDGCELNALDELRAFVEKWNGEQTSEIWEPDYSRAVMLDRAEVVP